MKKYRKQGVYVYGRKRLVDVPVDSKLYKADNRAEYQRRRSGAKHVSLNELIFACTADVADVYEKSHMLECLREALQALTKKERLLIECMYYNGFTQQETAEILMIAQQNVSKNHKEIIKKLRNSLKDWL